MQTQHRKLACAIGLLVAIFSEFATCLILIVTGKGWWCIPYGALCIWTAIAMAETRKIANKE